ncbi:MAG: hypothetical protein Q9219_003079 [cf. Caloplaca sp. 3 TL-2023]
MDPQSLSCPCPLRGPPSLFSRGRAQTLEKATVTCGNPTFIVGSDRGALSKASETNVIVDDLRETSEKNIRQETSPQTPSARTFRASFSGVLADIRTFPKRIVSQRRKMPADHTLRKANSNIYPDIISSPEESLKGASAWGCPDRYPHSRAPNWFRHRIRPAFRNRRQTTESSLRPKTVDWTQEDPSLSLSPIDRLATPIIPHDSSSGAAARAAAAEQNEMRRYFRKLCNKDRRSREDAESGIGVEIPSVERESAVLRLDPFRKLPSELFSHILSYLDAQSLINSELVSRAWHSVASDDLVWKNIFLHDFRPLSQTVAENSTVFQIRGQGLGAVEPEQDWKRMWRTRKALHQRWLDTHAAAIYLEGHYDSVYCVQFDEYEFDTLARQIVLTYPRDKIVTGSRDRTVRIWDARTYRCIKILGVPSRNTPISMPKLTAGDGPRPFTIIFSQQFKLEPYAGRPDIYHVGSILCLQYDNELMVTGSSDFACIMWDVKANWRPIRRLRYHTAGVLDVCFDKKHVVSCSKDTTVCLWDRETGELIHRLSGHRAPVNAVRLRGNLAVSASGDSVAKLWNLVSGTCIKEFPSKDRGMACVEFSPDSLTIFAGGNDQVVYQFDASTGELIREMNGHSALVRSLHLDSANGRLVSGSYDNTVRAYDIRTGLPVIHLSKWTASWILSAKIDYRRIIATSQDSRIVIIDFGLDLPGIDLLEHRRRSSLGSMTAGMGRLQV